MTTNGFLQGSVIRHIDQTVSPNQPKEKPVYSPSASNFDGNSNNHYVSVTEYEKPPLGPNSVTSLLGDHHKVSFTETDKALTPCPRSATDLDRNDHRVPHMEKAKRPLLVYSVSWLIGSMFLSRKG